MTYLLGCVIAVQLCGLYLLASLNARDEKAIVLHVAPSEQMQEQKTRPSEAFALPHWRDLAA